MRRGAIIPGSWTAIVVADEIDGSAALRPVLVESFELGRLMPLPDGKMVREFTDQDVDLLIARTVKRFADMGVESVLIEWTSSKASKFHAVAMALNLACAERGLPSSYAKRWRIWNASMHRDWVLRRIVEGYAGWPAGTFEVSRNCGVMLLESVSPDRPVQAPTPPKEPTHDPIRESSDAQITEAPAPGEPPEAVDSANPGESTALSDVDPSLPKRVAGIDPGSGYLALVIGEGEAKPITLVHAQTFTVGERVPLKKPRKIKRGKETITLTTRHSLTVTMAEGLAARVVAMLVRHRVAKLAIEHVESVHIDANQAAASSSIATALIRTSWIDILIGAGAMAAGIEVSRVNASTWRARVAGRARGKRGGAGAELIPDAVRNSFEKWPAAADAHIFDAGGVCLWLALPPPEPIPVKAPKPRVTKTTREGGHPPSYYARMDRLRKETEAKRQAAGCTCENHRRGRHRIGCPLGHANRPKETRA